MPNETLYNNKAISNIVYFHSIESEDDCCCFDIVPNREDLSLIKDPKEFEVVFIQNGTNGGVDIAIFYQGAWLIKVLKGAKGDRGEIGAKGDKGEPGRNGVDGLPGSPGSPGKPPAHRWDGTKLQFQNSDGSWGTLIDLKGADGQDGKDGKDGAMGRIPNHQWDRGTSLRFELPDGSWGVWVNLQGPEGQQGVKGDVPSHNWNPAKPMELRFQNADGTWGNYQDLQGVKGDKGDKGDSGTGGTPGLPPEHEVVGRKLRFKKPDGTWGEFINFGDNLDMTDPKCLMTIQEWVDTDDAGKFQEIIDAICTLNSAVGTGNLQKIITTDYILKSDDNNYVIIINNGADNVTITIPTGLKAGINVGFIQAGTGKVTFVGSGITLNSYNNLTAMKGQFCNAFIEKQLSDEVFYLFGTLG